MTCPKYPEYFADGNTLRVIKDTQMTVNEEADRARKLKIVAAHKKTTQRMVDAVNRRTGTRSRHGLIEFPVQVPIVVEGREYTRSQIAKAAGVDITHVSKIFRGERTPSLYRARLIAAAVGLDLAAFYDMLTRIDVGQEIPKEERLKSPIQPITF